jgi:hypothetical protein
MKTQSLRLGEALCDALGLPAKRVTRLTIRVDSTDLVRVDAEMIPDSVELDATERTIDAYTFRVDRR